MGAAGLGGGGTGQIGNSTVATAGTVNTGGGTVAISSADDVAITATVPLPTS